jgi:hypothetical protein
VVTEVKFSINRLLHTTCTKFIEQLLNTVRKYECINTIMESSTGIFLHVSLYVQEYNRHSVSLAILGG